ncbi:RDD family protein [Streptomyces sp. NPDC059909]|uniref:RDD family protein n=1 Tax=Streptomyces sp. NPDC059909 TaxID=3346998 RepID=UPI00365C11B5
MSAPTPATGDGSPAAGFYPDPSIPGYVRYWNGTAWVPGTSRPAPRDGESLPTPPASASAASTAPVTPATPATPSVEETGPVFLDEEPEPSAAAPEPASAWHADTSHQSGFGGDRDNRVSWGATPQDPRIGDAFPAGRPDPRAASGADPRPGGSSGVRFDRAAGPSADDPRAAAGGTAPADPTGGALPGVRSVGAGESKPVTDGTDTVRAQRPKADAPADGTMAIRALAPQQQPSQPQQQSVQAPPQVPAQQQAPVQQAPVQQAPVSAGAGGGAASWAQQVHQLAQAQAPEQPVVPWKPPVEDPFLQAAQAQAAARPAGLGKRFVARLIDTVVLGAVTGAVSFPFVSKALTHIDDKIAAAKMSGETVTVWLLDGTTITQFGIALAALLLLGVLYEALPTAKWGRTLGKKLLGLEVRDIESHGPPAFGAAVRRWLVHGVLGVLLIGVVNVLWCLFDRPWRQCWHDKAAHTFVAG